jgi:hypothetical protein
MQSLASPQVEHSPKGLFTGYFSRTNSLLSKTINQDSNVSEGSTNLKQALVLMEVALHLMDEAGFVAEATCNLDTAVNQLREAISRDGFGFSGEIHSNRTYVETEMGQF